MRIKVRLMGNGSGSKKLLAVGGVMLLASVCWAQSADDHQTKSTWGLPTPSSRPEREETRVVNFEPKSDGNNMGQTQAAKRLDNSDAVLDRIRDKGIPQNILAIAKCVAIVPSMINVAAGFGGRGEKGVATCRTTLGWSAPAPLTINDGSWGRQIEGEATDLVLLVMNQKGVDHLLSSKFNIGTEASSAAGPVGREAAGHTDWKLRAEILSYARSRGAFAGLDLSGAAVTQDKDETALLYSKYLPFESILSGKVPSPTSARTFLAAVRKVPRGLKKNKGNRPEPCPCMPSAYI